MVGRVITAALQYDIRPQGNIYPKNAMAMEIIKMVTSLSHVS